MCEVIDGESEQFNTLRHNVLNFQQGDSLHERIMNSLDDMNVRLDKHCKLVFISNCGILNLGLNLSSTNDRKLRRNEWRELDESGRGVC